MCYELFLATIIFACLCAKAAVHATEKRSKIKDAIVSSFLLSVFFFLMYSFFSLRFLLYV